MQKHGPCRDTQDIYNGRLHRTCQAACGIATTHDNRWQQSQCKFVLSEVANRLAFRYGRTGEHHQTNGLFGHAEDAGWASLVPIESSPPVQELKASPDSALESVSKFWERERIDGPCSRRASARCIHCTVNTAISNLLPARARAWDQNDASWDIASARRPADIPRDDQHGCCHGCMSRGVGFFNAISRSCRLIPAMERPTRRGIHFHEPDPEPHSSS